jgi:hypothetical protein
MHRWERLFSKELTEPNPVFALDVPKTAVAHDGEVDVSSISDLKAWQDLVFGCTHCKFKFESLEILFKHLRNDVPKKRGAASWQIKCPDCWKLMSRPQFLNHAREHHPSLMFTCVYCSKTYQNLGVLLKHYVEHHEDFNDVFFCLCCGLYFTSLQSLKFHKDKEHDRKPKKVPERILNRRESILISPKAKGPPKPRGREKGVTNSLLMCRRENLKRLAEYKRRSAEDRSMSSKNSDNEDENDENQSSGGRSFETRSEPSERGSDNASESGNFEEFIEPSRTLSGALSMIDPCDPLKLDPLEPHENESKPDLTTMNVDHQNSYDTERKFLSPSYFSKPCPKSKKSENVPDNHQTTPENSSEEKSVRASKPCPLSKKPKLNPPSSHEKSNETDSKTEKYHRIIVHKLQDLKKENDILDFDCRQGKYFVKLTDGTWMSFLEHSKLMKKVTRTKTRERRMSLQ